MKNVIVFAFVATIIAVIVPSCAAMTVTEVDSLNVLLAPDRLALLPALTIPKFSNFTKDIDEWEKNLDMRIRVHSLQLQMLLERETPLLVELDKAYFSLTCTIVALASTLILTIVYLIITEVAAIYQRCCGKTIKEEKEVEKTFFDCDEQDLHLSVSTDAIATVIASLPILEFAVHRPPISIQNDGKEILHIQDPTDAITLLYSAELPTILVTSLQSSFEPLHLSSFAININSPSVEPEQVQSSLTDLPVPPLICGSGGQQLGAALGGCKVLPGMESLETSVPLPFLTDGPLVVPHHHHESTLSSSPEDVHTIIAHKDAPVTSPDVVKQMALASNSKQTRKEKRKMKRAMERASRAAAEKFMVKEQAEPLEEQIVDDGFGWKVQRNKSSMNRLKKEMRMRNEEDEEDVEMVEKWEVPVKKEVFDKMVKKDVPIVAKWVMTKRLEVEVDEEETNDKEEKDSLKWTEYLQMKKGEKESNGESERVLSSVSCALIINTKKASKLPRVQLKCERLGAQAHQHDHQHSH